MFSTNLVSNYCSPERPPALADDCSKKVTMLNHTVQVSMDETSAKVSTIPNAHEPMQESLNQKRFKRTIADVDEPMEEPLNQLQVKRPKHCEVTTMAGQNTAEFKKDDRLLIYPSSLS